MHLPLELDASKSSLVEAQDLRGKETGTGSDSGSDDLRAQDLSISGHHDLSGSGPEELRGREVGAAALLSHGVFYRALKL